MLKSKNIFVCIGAIHHDYLLNLKKNIINFRSNQIIQKSRIGGVAYNIAELLSNFVDVNFYSLAINEEIRKKHKPELNSLISEQELIKKAKETIVYITKSPARPINSS